MNDKEWSNVAEEPQPSVSMKHYMQMTEAYKMAAAERDALKGEVERMRTVVHHAARLLHVHNSQEFTIPDRHKAFATLQIALDLLDEKEKTP